MKKENLEKLFLIKNENNNIYFILFKIVLCEIILLILFTSNIIIPSLRGYVEFDFIYNFLRNSNVYIFMEYIINFLLFFLLIFYFITFLLKKDKDIANIEKCILKSNKNFFIKITSSKLLLIFFIISMFLEYIYYIIPTSIAAMLISIFIIYINVQNICVLISIIRKIKKQSSHKNKS